MSLDLLPLARGLRALAHGPVPARALAREVASPTTIYSNLRAWAAWGVPIDRCLVGRRCLGYAWIDPWRWDEKWELRPIPLPGATPFAGRRVRLTPREPRSDLSRVFIDLMLARAEGDLAESLRAAGVPLQMSILPSSLFGWRGPPFPLPTYRHIFRWDRVPPQKSTGYVTLLDNWFLGRSGALRPWALDGTAFGQPAPFQGGV